jgi:hypothetical protein
VGANQPAENRTTAAGEQAEPQTGSAAESSSGGGGGMDTYMQAIASKAYYAKKKEEGGSRTTLLLRDRKQPPGAAKGGAPAEESRARKAIRSKREADLAPKTWRQFEDDFDPSPVKPLNKRVLLQKKVLELQRIHVTMKTLAAAESIDEQARDTRLRDLQRFEAMTKREVADLRKSLGVHGA